MLLPHWRFKGAVSEHPSPVLVVSTSPKGSAFCNQGHGCLRLYPSQRTSCWEWLGLWNTVFLLLYQVLLKNLTIYVINEMRLNFTFLWPGDLSMWGSSQWVTSVPIRHNFVPICWKFFYEEKNKNWFELLCQPFFPHLSQHSPISTVLFVWHSSKMKRKKCSFWVDSL